MRERRSRMAALAAVLATVMLATVSPMASGAATRFGSRLNSDASANSTQSCPISTKTCTWILAEPYQRPTGLKAPRDGTIRKIRVMAYDKGGSFRPVLARIRDGGNQAKVVKRGPLLTYNAQPDIENFPYVIQVFSVNLSVRKGDVLGIEAKRTSLLNCSGQFLPRFQPALAVGGSFRTQTSDTGCTLMVEAQYG